MQGVDKDFGVAKNFTQEFNYFTPLGKYEDHYHDPGIVSEGGGEIRLPPHYSNAADEISIGKK